MLQVRLPARINLVGSPTDAVEGAYATVSAAVSVYGGASADEHRHLRFERSPDATVEFDRKPIQDHSGFDIEAAAVNALFRHSPEFQSKLAERGIRISTWTNVPASSGMAGSSVLLLAVLAALRAHYELDRWRHNDYVLAEIAQRAEEHEMGIVCGFADRYVPLFGGLAYLSYHGKLWHAPLGDEPFVTYEPLTSMSPDLPLVVATTGVERNSGSVHAPMRARYLEERRAGRGPLLALGRELGETAWRGKMALLSGDLAGFGRQVDRNQSLVDQMMTLCGFEAGAGTEVRVLVDAARAAGAYGAKLTGAGGGGAIFAVCPDGHRESIVRGLRTAAANAGLQRAVVFPLSVAPRGLDLKVAP